MAVMSFCIILLSSFEAYSDGFFDDDESSVHGVYVSPEIIIGNYVGLGINWTYTYDKSYSLQLGASWMFKKASSLPDDYYAYEQFVTPVDDLTHIHLTLGKILYLNSIETIRLHMNIGAAHTIISEPINWVEKPNNEYRLQNKSHDNDYFKYSKTSLVFSPRIEFIPINFFGFYIEPSYFYNSDRPFLGVKAGLMFGMIN